MALHRKQTGPSYSFLWITIIVATSFFTVALKNYRSSTNLNYIVLGKFNIIIIDSHKK